MVSKRNGTENVGKQGKLDNVTGFSWNLTLDGKVNVEGYKVNLHDTINLQSDSLIGIKQQFAERLFDGLENSKKRKLAQLVHSTDVQIEKNLKMVNKAREMKNEVLTLMKKYPELEGDFMVKLKNLVVSPVDIQKNLGQEQKYLNIYKILIVEMIKELNRLLDDAKEQGDMKKQKKYEGMYKMLLGDEFLRKKHGSFPDNEVADYEGELGGLLSLHEAPWINLNIEGASYKINKGEKYDDEDGRGKIEENIRNVIKNEIRQKKVDDDFVDFVLKFILEPFGVGGDKYDEETLKYYVYSIIDCIKNTDVVGKIQELFEKRKQIEERLNKLEDDLSDISSIINNVRKIKDGSPYESKYSIQNNSEFKKGVFAVFLEENGKDEYLNILKNLDYDVIGNAIRTQDLVCRDEDFESRDSFVNLFCRIGKFLGKELSEDKKIKWGEFINSKNTAVNDYDLLSDLARELHEICDKKVDERSVEDKNKLQKFCEWFEMKYSSEVLIKSRRKEILKDKALDFLKTIESRIIKGNRVKYRSFREFAKILQYLKSGDEKKFFINDYFKGDFGIYLNETEINSVDDKVLLKSMVKLLVNKINEDRKDKCKILNDLFKKRLNRDMNRKHSEDDVLQNIDMKLKKSLCTFFSEFNCTEYNEKSKNLKNKFEQLKMELSGCKTMESYKGLEEKIKNFENDEDLKEFQGNREMLNRCENRETCDISQIGRDDNAIKWLLALKKLFNSKDLTLEEKFDYSNVILKNITQSKNSKITSKNGEHDEILESLFGEENVIRRCKKQKVETDESIDDDNENRKKEKELLDKLQSSEDKFESFIDELKKLSGFNDSEVELNRLEKKRTPLLRSLDSEKNEQKKLKILKELFPKSENMKLKDLNQKLDKVKKNLKKYKDNTKLKILKELFPKSVNNEQELRGLKELFPKSVISYIDTCISDNELSFGNSLRAINYKTGVLDFSVIKAGILGKAVEEGKVTDVLEYLGFKFGEGVDKGEIDNEVQNRLTDVSSTIGCIIQGYRQDNVGCFSDDYLTLGEGSVKLFGNYVRSQGNGSKFTIGHKTDKFRFDGKIKDGKFVIERYFSRNKDGEETRHKSHKDYINRG